MGFLPLLAGGALAVKGASKLFGHKSKTKANDEQRRAATAALNTRQKMTEDKRIGRLKLGASMLGSVPKTTAGGGVNTNLDIDPAILAQLGAERTYDFGSTVPNMNEGATWAFLSGLAGDVGDFGVDYAASRLGGDPESRLNAAAGAQGPLAGGPGLAATPTVSWEDLMNASDEDVDD